MKHNSSPTPIVYGTPGRHAGLLAARALGLASVCALGIGAVAGALAVSGALTAPGHNIAWIGVSIVAIMLLAYGFSTSRANFAKASIGRRSERRVAKVLAQMRPTAVLNSTLIGAGGDCDHIVLGPCAAVVETKTGAGQVVWRTGGLYHGTRRIPGNPVSQCTRQARRVHELTGCYIEAIVCVVDMVNDPFRSANATVCSLADLPGVLKASPHVLDPDRAAFLASKLHRLGTELAATPDGAGFLTDADAAQRAA